MVAKRISLLILIGFTGLFLKAQSPFVTCRNGHFFLKDAPYYYIGANYWYGGLLANDEAGRRRIRAELDFLSASGVNNLRIMAGAEGRGRVNGVSRVAPALQPDRGVFNINLLKGLDFLLAEMGKRKMKAIIFLSNNWEWSGGFLQYLNWNGLLPDSVMPRKLSWDEMRDYVSLFYQCTPCREQYEKQVALIVNRVNAITRKLYRNDPAIMAWELANEPRPMRLAAIPSFEQWIGDAAAFIKSLDKNHLVTTGSEGEQGSETIEVFKTIHAIKNIDYCTIHIWPKNWGWFKDTSIAKALNIIIANTEQYIDAHAAVARELGKPLVIEEFGLPRDNHSFLPEAATSLRDRYYACIFEKWQSSRHTKDVIGGCNFWAFSGSGRPAPRHNEWQPGDDVLGDPPQEEQGLNSVFDSDRSTWALIASFTGAQPLPGELPSDPKATAETQHLYGHMQQLVKKGCMIGHQDDLAYGVNWKYKEGGSDIKEVTDDYPAVYGWDLSGLERPGAVNNIDGVPFKKMRRFIQEGYARGGVITMSWHADNPLTGKNAWDTTHGTVVSILPGGANHTLYKTWLDNIAAYLLSLKGKRGELIPVLFRPYHELTGTWFWWCRNNCTPEQFKTLWRFTNYYLREVKQVHNLLYVFNEADFRSKEDFMRYYPGDDMTDVVSFDAYQYNDPTKDNGFVKDTDRKLAILDSVAAETNKITALAETGYEQIPYAEWWTETLLKMIGQHPVAYVLFWRNAGYVEQMGKMHYYVPFKGQVSEADFKKFYGLDRTLFEKDVAKEKLYE